MAFVRPNLVGLYLAFTIPGIICDGHSNQNICEMESNTCEFYLDVSTLLPMRRGVGQKVYINETNGKLYIHGDTSNTTVDPDEVVLADGSKHDRVLMLFNKTMPGPTLTVYVEQEVVVHVTNRLQSDSATVHFHGIEMRGTPWMDGAAFVTQCPILPGQTFTYRFRPNRSGTYFYHSHTGGQVSMGMLGAFIVKEKKTNEMDEHVMVIQDYNNLHSSDEIYLSHIQRLITQDGVTIGPRPRTDGSFSPLLKITSSLINGRGRMSDENGNHLTKTPLSVFRVNQGASYRFRIIGGGYGYQHKLSVDGHKLKVVATDGNDIEPVIVDFVVIHSGERFDLILEANKTVDNFWIRAETFHETKELTGYAILRYVGAEEGDPASDINECTEEYPCSVVNCPFETYPNWSCITTDKMRAADRSDSAPLPRTGNFKEFFINTGYALSDDNVVYGHMNGVSLKLPTVSALTQPREVTGICEAYHNCLPDKVCYCNRPLDVNFGDIVQINFLNAGFLNILNHPIHVHGYSFQVLKVGFPETFTADVNCTSPLCYSNASWINKTWYGGNLPDVDLARAPHKDTVVLPAGGYVVIRFVADNPGLWYIHCHQEVHNQMGMGFLLNDSFAQIPAPPAGFPECRNYPPLDWLVNPETATTTEETSTQATTGNTVTEADERTFSREEFWGMFAALMFVILLQFVLAMTCSRRTQNKLSL